MDKKPSGLDYDLKIDIGLVGNMSVGKTLLIKRFISKDTKKCFSTVSTIGIDIQSIKLKFNDMIVKVVIWDPAGQERFENITKSYI